MKCYNHPNENAIAQCPHCGKGLCQTCAQKWSPPICDDCQKVFINEELSSINRELMFYVGLVIVGAIFGGIMGSGISHSLSEAFSVSILYACSFPMYLAGWKWLNHITDYFTLLATPKFWLIYILIKLMFSAIVGIFALPYRLFRIHTRKKELNLLLSHI